MDRKLDGSSVEFDRGFAGILVVCAYAVAVSAVVLRASVQRLGVI